MQQEHVQNPGHHTQNLISSCCCRPAGWRLRLLLLLLLLRFEQRHQLPAAFTKPDVTAPLQTLALLAACAVGPQAAAAADAATRTST
jgi:hypothetical protein